MVCFPSTLAPPLTLDSILSAVQGVKRWFGANEVAFWLVGGEKRDQLKRDHENDKDGGTSVVVETWLLKDDHPTWRKLICALDWAKESTIADSIRSYAEPVRG